MCISGHCGEIPVWNVNRNVHYVTTALCIKQNKILFFFKWSSVWGRLGSSGGMQPPAAVVSVTVAMLEMSLIGESFHWELLTFPQCQERDLCLDSVRWARIPQTCDLSKSSFLAETLGKHLGSHKSIHRFCIWDVNISWVTMKGSVLATNLRAPPAFRMFLISCCGPGSRENMSQSNRDGVWTYLYEERSRRFGETAASGLLRRYLNLFH